MITASQQRRGGTRPGPASESPQHGGALPSQEEGSDS